MFDHILAQEIAVEEGFETQSYTDTKGLWTIGIGHLLGKNPRFSNLVWTPTKVMVTFMQDLNSSIYYTKLQIRVYDQLSPTRQRVLVNMMFNLGPDRFSGFVNTIAAINMHDYNTAYNEMLDSKWARVDVPKRAIRLSQRWISG